MPPTLHSADRRALLPFLLTRKRAHTCAITLPPARGTADGRRLSATSTAVSPSSITQYSIARVNHIILVDLGDDDRVGGSGSNADEELLAGGLNRVIPEELAAGMTHTIGSLDSARPGSGAVAFTVSTDSTDGRDGTFAASSGDFSITGDASSGFRLIFTAPAGGSGDFESSPPTYPVWVRSVRNGITDTAGYTLRLFDVSGS